MGEIEPSSWKEKSNGRKARQEKRNDQKRVCQFIDEKEEIRNVLRTVNFGI